MSARSAGLPATLPSAREAPMDAPFAVARGAPEEALRRPAGAFLEDVAWAGPAPDPDALDAAAFLAWL